MNPRRWVGDHRAVLPTGYRQVGRETEKINSGETIAISSKERTVVDLMRLRSRVGRDLALGALRRYLQDADAKPGELLAAARRLRIASIVSAAMEPLLA
jgi:hypothetical protein